MTSPNPQSERTLDESLDRIQSAAQQQAATVHPDDVASAVAETTHYEIEAIKQQLKEATETHDLRKEYLPKLFWLIVAWLVVVILFVVAASLKLIALSDSVLIAFITSTTVSVLGLFMLAAKWLFPSSIKDEGNKRN